MSASIVACPSCSQQLRVMDRSKRVRCPKCSNIFVPQTPAEQAREREEEQVKVSDPLDFSNVEPEEEDDRPRRKRRGPSDEDEEDAYDRLEKFRKRKQEKDDEEDEDDDRPRRRRSRRRRSVQRTADPRAGAEAVGTVGIFMIIFGVLALVSAIGIVALATAAAGNRRNPDNAVVFYVWSTLLMVSGGIQLAGGINMRTLNSYGFSMFAAIVAVIPLTCGCWIITLPIGIWALVVLSQEEVKLAYQQKRGL